jgi:phosphoribosylamine--glycine ligase
VVLAAAGYPDSPRRGDLISGLDRLDPSILAFHAGTSREPDGSLHTSGGRVLTLVARGDTLEAARQQVYAALPEVHFEGMQYRSDIGLEQIGDR